MNYVMGITLGGKLCDLLGLDKNKIESINILCHLDHPAAVEVIYRVYSDELIEIVDEFHRYRIVEEPF
jgi:hypothetical protein